MKKSTAIFVLFFVMACVLPGVTAAGATTRSVRPNRAAQLRRAADKHYAQGSYAIALNEYRRWLKQAPPVREDRTLVTFRIAVALGKAEKWDEAVEATEAFLATHKHDLLWTARGQYQRGLLLIAVPHQGYKVGTRVYRGDDYPQVAGAEKPEAVGLDAEDGKASLHALESALAAFERLPAAVKRSVSGEEIDLYFDLARVVASVQPWGTDHDWALAKTTDWKIEPARAYNPAWPAPKKVLYLYERLPALNNTRHSVVLAELARAAYIASARNGWFQYVPNTYKVAQIIPYRNLDPIAILLTVAARYPNDLMAPQLLLVAARATTNKGDDVRAVAIYRSVISKYRSNVLVNDAKNAVQSILAKSLHVTTPGPEPVGRPAVITLASHNLSHVKFTAYRVKLESIYSTPKKLHDPGNRFSSFVRNFGHIRNAPSLGVKVAEWVVTTRDKRDYHAVSETIRTPLTKAGAYIVQATSPDGRVRAATMVVVTDLALIRKVERDSIFFFAANARTGRPERGASVIVRERYEHNERYKIAAFRGATDSSGIYVAPKVQDSDTSIDSIEAFAYTGEGRYAVVNGEGNFWDSEPDDENGVAVYAYTDRPVYRPGQTVNFREILARGKSGSEFAALAGRRVMVTVNDSHGQQIHKEELTASKFGTVNGSFKLAAGAPLGEYTISASLRRENGRAFDDIGSSRFRVEEYKKPEYEVTIKPSTTQARFGEKVTASVEAKYYFGSPVANAKGTYKVFRKWFTPSYQFPEPYDWFYASNGNGGYYESQDGELVTQGAITTDASGNATMAFTPAPQKNNPNGDFSYTIRVEITDSSRRVITGEGDVKVTHAAFYAYMRIPRGFYHRGDKVQVELRTQDANEQAVTATGSLTVERIGYTKRGIETAMKVYSSAVSTDSDGKAFTVWPSESSGQYRISFATTDQRGNRILAKQRIWVSGSELANREIRVGGITLVTDKTTYEQGETAHVLVVADKPDNWVLLTQETGDQILKRSVIPIAGYTSTIDVPIRRAHIPNFALAAVAMRDYKVYTWQQELFVPPSRQFLNVAMTSDKPEYKPGETGVFQVKATDYRGLPVASEVSLAVVDSSIYYIQGDYADDIRKHFYGGRRSVGIAVQQSGEFQTEGVEETDIRRKMYPAYELVMLDMGSLHDGSQYGLRFTNSGYMLRNGYEPPDTLGATTEVPSTGGLVAGGKPISLSWSARSGAVPAQAVAKPMSVAAVAPAKPAVLPLPPVAKTAPPGFGGGGRPAQFAPTQVRTDFRDTAFWTPAIVTDPITGMATVRVTFPDSLTTWKATARGLTTGVLVGAADTQAVTSKKLLVRLEAPRFFVERDQVVLSAIAHNNFAVDKQVRVSLTTDPGLLSVDGAGLTQMVIVPAGGEKRVDWTARVTGDGTATVKMSAESDEESDAAQLAFPVLTYGVQKFVAASGVMQSAEHETKLHITVPEEHKPGSAMLMVQITPSLAATALDALPYLSDFPYGCVEQTMDRWLPTVVVSKALGDAGVDLETLHKRAAAMSERAVSSQFGDAKPADNNTDQNGYTYPSGTPGVMKTAQLAEGLWHTERWKNPVFDPGKQKQMVKEGLARIVSMQRPTGGWGWWADSAESDPYMTAYVLYGLKTARAAGVDLDDRVIASGEWYLETDIKNRDDQRDLAVWEAFALSTSGGGKIGKDARRVVDAVYIQRDRLSAYGQALLALTLHNINDDARATVVCENLRNTATIDANNGTATWKPRDDGWWQWYNNDVETAAWVLKAYAAIMPKSEITPMLVKWLVNNRKGNTWNSTKETAMVVSALTDYIRANNELAPDETVTVALGEKVSRTYKIDRDNALLFDNSFLVPDALLPGGAQTVTITKSGPGRLYYASALQYFTTEEKIRAAGKELQVNRRYFKLTPKVKQQADWDGGKYNVLDYSRAELPDGASVQSGDLIEVELGVTAKNDYDYVLFEDMKPAGCEPLDLRSGERYGDFLCSNVEFRDTKTAFFVDHLPQGSRMLRYRLRAEVPGTCHALPTNAYAMYAPDVRALSDGWKVTVGDEKQLDN